MDALRVARRLVGRPFHPKSLGGKVVATGAVALLLAMGFASYLRHQHDQLVERAAHGETPEARADALIHLATAGDENGIDDFIRATRDPALAVRVAAALSLSTIRSQRGVNVLGEMLLDPEPAVQNAALKALREIGGERAQAELIRGYGQVQGPLRRAIDEAIGPAGLARAVQAEAETIWARNLQALQSGTLVERVGAAEELGLSGRPDAVERLVPLLGKGSMMLSEGAMRGLVVARDPRTLSTFKALLKAADPRLVASAVAGVAGLGDLESIPLLEAMAKEESNRSPVARNALLQMATEGGLAPAREALGRLSLPIEPAIDAPPPDAEALVEALLNDNPNLRARTARALAGADAKVRQEVKGELEALRFDYYAEVRRAAEAALKAP